MIIDLVDRESRRRQVQAQLDARKTARERNVLGQFATPPQLARQIADYVYSLWQTNDEPLRFLEPALGTGAFYAALREVFPSTDWASATGIEIDADVAAAASDLWLAAGLDVRQADFTRQTPPPDGMNLIVANPPYVRHHHLSGDEKVRLQTAVASHTGLALDGLAGLYCYFLLLSDAWLSRDGIGVWLIPSEFMSVNYGATLKRYLTEQVTLLHIHCFDPEDAQFTDALVTSAIVVFQKTPPSADCHAVLSYGGTIAQPRETTLASFSQLRQTRKWMNLIAASEDASVEGGATLAQLFKVRRGIATSSNAFFVMPRGEARARGIPDQFLRPILPSPRHLTRTVVESDADGWPLLPNSMALLDCRLDEARVAADYPELWTYLNGEEAQQVASGYLSRKRRPWYRQEQREPAPFICTYMGRKRANSTPVRFIWNQSQAITANVYLMLYPVGLLAEALAHDPGLYPVIFSLLEEIEEAELIGQGRVYGGGLHKMEPAELGRVSARRFLAAIESVGPLSSPRQLALL